MTPIDPPDWLGEPGEFDDLKDATRPSNPNGSGRSDEHGNGIGVDAADGPRVVPAYALTGGRTHSVGHDLPWETLATATHLGTSSLSRLRFERAQIVRLCRRPCSLAEVAADLGVPLGVARVLVSDLCADGLLIASRPALDANGRPRVEILERLLDGLKART